MPVWWHQNHVPKKEDTKLWQLLWCGVISTNHYTTNLLENQPVKEFRKLVKITLNYWHKLVVFVFLEHSDLVHLDHAKDASVLVHCVFWTISASCLLHTHPFNGPFSGTTRVSRYQNGKSIWILLKQETVSGSGISWAVCKSVHLAPDK